MSKKHKSILKLIAIGALICAAACLSPLWAHKTASAVDLSIQQKVSYNALNTCMRPQNQLMASPISGEVDFYIRNVANSEKKFIVAPTYVDDKNSENLEFSCYDLFAGIKIRSKNGEFPGYKVPGLLPSGVNSSYTAQDLGYVPSGEIKEKYCLKVYYDYKEIGEEHSSPAESNDLCFPVKDGKINTDNIADFSPMPEPENQKDGQLYIGYNGYHFIWVVPSGGSGSFPQCVNCSLESFVDDVSVTLHSDAFPPLVGDARWQTISNPITSAYRAPGSFSTEYMLDDKSSLKALHFVSGDSNLTYTDVTIRDDDYYILYKSYINYVVKYYRGEVYITSNCSSSSDVAQYAWTEDGKTWCEVGEAEKVTQKFGGRSDKNPGASLTVMSFTDILASAKKLNMTLVEDSSFGEINGQVNGSSGSTSSSQTEGGGTPICTQVSGVLSWVLCPVLKFIGDTASKLYGWIADVFLVIPSSIFSTADRDKGVYGGWSTFRNFANVVFAILLAIVILAQITGIGLSNYNVKKILPRLIVAVVLVNISYILCQLAVDLSNIVGHGVYDLLNKLADGTFNFGAVGDLTEQLTSGSYAGEGLLLKPVDTGTSTGQTIASVSVVGLVGLVSWRLWLLPLFLTLVSSLVAVLFFFLTLGIRQAGVIIAVVVAPLAIICYSLPNTKTVFDKWWKIFSSLLLVYPICGALMGGGAYAATIMIQSDSNNFLYFIIAMLLTVIPFFLVPTILRNSLNGINMLGNKLSGLSRSAQRGASGAMAKTQRFQDAQRRIQAGRARAAMRRHDDFANSKLAKSRLGQAISGLGSRLDAYSKTDPTGNWIQRQGGRLARGAAGTLTAASRANRRAYARNARMVMAGQREQFEADSINSTLAGEDRKQFEIDRSNADALLRQGGDYNDDKKMGAEYRTALDEYLRNPHDKQKLARVAALQDRLSRTDDGAAYMMSALTHAAATNNSREMRNAIQDASAHINADALKSKNRNYFKTVQDFANGNFSQANDISQLKSYKDGDQDIYYAAGYNNTLPGLKYSGASFAGLDNSAFKQLKAGIEDKTIDDKHLGYIMDAANNALVGAANGTIALDQGAADYARQILAAGYARGGVVASSPGTDTPGPVITRTAGSQAISQADTPSLGTLVSGLQSGTIDLDQAKQIAENMQYAYTDASNDLSNDKIAQMKQFVTETNRQLAAAGKPITVDANQFEPTRVDIPRERKRRKLPPKRRMAK